ncbi:unnamed protein product, partial [Rotaria magnacalcarata]
HERARYCPTVQLHFPKHFLKSIQTTTTNNPASLPTPANLLLINT